MDWFLTIIIIAIVVLLIWLIIVKAKTPKIDWNRYLGTWHEIARLPNPFEKGCTNATARYSMNEDGTISVINSCEINGQSVTTKGTAKIVGKNKLSVKFDDIESDYVVYYISPDYQTAIVGSSNKEYLWILARSPSLDAETYKQLVDRAAKAGFDTNKLILNK